MRLKELAALLFTLVLGMQGAYAGDQTLKGSVTESANPRLKRPPGAAQGAAKSESADAGKPARAPFVESADFDLDSQQFLRRSTLLRQPAPANFAVGFPEEPRGGSRDLDRFFAFAHNRPLIGGANGFSAGIFGFPQQGNPAKMPFALAAGNIPRGTNITVSMGLCGAWDAQGEGARRWETLSSERGHPGPLSQAWQDWQRQIGILLRQHAAQLRVTRGLAALHVVVHRDGSFADITVYDGDERQFADVELAQTTTAILHNVLRETQRFPPFPDGSQVEEVHVLVFGWSN